MSLPLSYFVVFTGSFASEKAADLEYELRDHVPEGWLKVIVAGVLTKLWHRAAHVGEELGDLGVMPRRRLARTLGWPGDPDVLIEALLVSGWIDQVDGDPDAFRCHNWAKRQPAISKRIADRERKQAQRAKTAQTEPEESQGQEATSGDVTRTRPENAGGSRDLTPKTDRKIDREIDRYSDLGGHEAASPDDQTVQRIAALEWPAVRSKGQKEDPAPWRAPPPLIRQWLASAPPGKDVLLEVLQAHAWLHEDLSRKKTSKGYPKFIGGWLRRPPKQWGAPPGALGQAPAAGVGDVAQDDPWDVLLEAVKATPRNERVQLRDEVMAHALTTFGGSNRIRMATPREHPQLRRDFYEALKAARAPKRAPPAQDPGPHVLVGGGR